MHMGDRLKEERERLGLNQTDFAALAQATRKALFNWETGTAAPNAVALAAWAAVGLDVLYVVIGKRSGFGSLTAEEETMLGYFRDASKEVRRAALGALIGAPTQSAGGPVIHGHVAGSVAGRDIIKGAGKR